MILNYNNALNANFKIAFPKISDLEFYAHSINVPTIQLNPIEVKYQDSRAKVPDNFYSWDDVTIQYTGLIIFKRFDKPFPREVYAFVLFALSY